MELYEAIREISKQYGIDCIQKENFFNMLSDFQAFKGFPACRAIVKVVFVQGYGGKILSNSIANDECWETILQQYIFEVVQKNGFQENLVKYVFQSIAFGIGWTSEIPQNPQLSTSSPSLSIRIHKGNGQCDDGLLPYNPQFDLFHYTMPSADLFEEDDGYEYHMRKIVESDLYRNCTYELPIAIGYNENHELVMTDLTKLPHLLVAGATGQGKSTWLHTALASLLCAKHPSELKLVLIDMSRLELNFYSIIERHYLAMLPASDYPIISDSKQVDNTLNSLCIELDNRYDLLKAAGVRNVKEYNLKFCKRFLSPTDGHRFLPYIVIFFDEFADVIFSEGKAAEEPMTKLARLGCSVGIHMIITTKCTINKIISNNIKSCFPSRLAFRVASSTDSRLIIDIKGAECLRSEGDSLFTDGRVLLHTQSPYMSSEEINRLTRYIANQQGYPTPFLLPEYPISDCGFDNYNEYIDGMNTIDSCFMDAATLIVETQMASSSLLQREMKLGYARVGRIMDQLEEFKIVGPAVGSKIREVKVKSIQELRMIFARMGLI